MNDTAQVMAGIVALSGAFGDCKTCKPNPPPPPPPIVYGCESGYVCDLDAPNVVVANVAVSPGATARFTASGAVISVRHAGAELAVGHEAVDAGIPSDVASVEVIVRNAGPSQLTTSLEKDGAAVGGAFGLAPWGTTTWTIQKDARLEGVRLPNGARDTLAIAIMKEGGLGIDRFVVGGGTAGGAFVADPPQATREIAIVVTAGAAGRARLVQNDYKDDADKDGIGARLEAVLGTCSQSSGTVKGPDGVPFDCKNAIDARDTDGDGLSDGLEVLGRRDASPHQPLALYGADPRHKDMFVEVDFQRRDNAEAGKKMRPDVARRFADYYGNRVGLPAQDTSRLADNAVALRNPDGKPGISVHQDTGVAPERAEDATIYGDWGGYTAVAPVSNGQGGVMGKPVGQAWRDDMVEARRGLFRYSLPYASGGGSTGVGISWQFGIDDAWGLAHESGHANGLGHGGPLDLPEPNCKPNYQSMMNYAYQSVPQAIGFSDGHGATALDDASLVEQQAVDPAEDFYLDLLQNTYAYNVDRAHGHVDWNRDGEFSSTPVKAYANYKPGGGGCEYTRCSGMAATPDKTLVTPAIARHEARTYVFYASNASDVRFKASTSAFNCPAQSASCGAFEESGSFSGDGTGGIDAARIGSTLYVVYRGGDGSLSLRTIASTRAVSSPAVIASGVSGEPALASDGCELSLAYKVSGTVRMRRVACGQSTFGAEELVSSVIGAKSSPALVYAFLPPFDNDLRLYAWLTDANHNNELWRYDGTLPVAWSKLALFDGGSRSYGRAGLAVVGKKLYAAYPVAVDDEQQRMIEWQQSYIKRDASSGVGTLRIGLKGPYDNVWAYGRGIDFSYEAGADTNLRAVANWIRPEGSPADDSVWFLPKADAINAYVMENYDDWPHLGVGICKGVVNPGNTVADPIRCRDWPTH